MLKSMMRFVFALLNLSVAVSSLAAEPPATAPATAAPLQWHRAQLPNGVRLIVIHAPAAKSQTTFTFLPVHLANDDADRAQWAHLLEHMLIRATDAEGLQADGVTFNGETTGGYLRLETMAEPAKWKNGLERHARWLATRDVDAMRLEREKAMIAGEENTTAASGNTDKFAIAAWNQIIMHNRPAAHVHGDVQAAQAADVAAYVASRVRLDSSALIATIGPTPADDVRMDIERLFAADPEQAEPRAAATPLPDAPADEPQSVRATWDLPTRHALWWWPLPDDRPQTLAAATGVARSLMLRVRSRRDFTRRIRQVLVHPCIVTQRGQFLVVDACLAADAAPDDLSRIVSDCAAALCDRDNASSRQSIVFAARLAAQELDPAPDFAAMAQHVPEPLRDSVEGLWLLSLLNYEFAFNAPAGDVRGMLMQLDDVAVAEVLNRVRKQPHMLTIEPE